MPTDTPVTTVAASTETTAAVTTDNVTTAAPGVTLGDQSTGSDPTKEAPKFDTAAWLAGLDQESRELATKKKWGGPSDLTKSYVELERAFSTRSTETPATYTADAYKFTLPQNAKDIGYDETFANGFRQLALDAKMSPEVAANVHDWYTRYATESLATANAQYVTQVKEQVQATEAELVKSWGTTNNPAFKRNAELAQRAINQLGVMDDMVRAGAIIESDGVKTVANAKLFQMFAKVGQAMYAEDTLHGPSVTNGKNPFDPSTADMNVQGELIKNDPERALLLIGALSPADQGMWQPVMPSIRARVKK